MANDDIKERVLAAAKASSLSVRDWSIGPGLAGRSYAIYEHGDDFVGSVSVNPDTKKLQISGRVRHSKREVAVLTKLCHLYNVMKG